MPPGHPPSGSPGPGLKILIVDDEPVNVRVMRMMLSSAGYTLLEASTGEECLEMVRREQPDIVLLDVVLPGLSGSQVSEHIKSDPEMAGTYVILVSASRVSLDDRIEGLVGGADSYLPRPFSRKELLAYIASGARVRWLIRRLEEEVDHRQRSEAELRETVRLLSMAERMASLGSWQWHPEADVLQVSDRVLDLLGLPHHQRPLGSIELRALLLERVHEEDRPRVAERLAGIRVDSASRAGFPEPRRPATDDDRPEDRAAPPLAEQSPPLEFRYHLDDGRVCVLRSEILVTRDPHGCLAVHGCLQDVTDRVAREQERARLLELERDRELALQRATLMRNLHDGIAGIATNITLLAELGLESTGADQLRRSLETIRDLGREGMSEVQSFMDTLEEATLTWRSLFANMRRHGTTMLEPHGILVQARPGGERLDDRVDRFVYMNVLRVFKEAITNVIKHARATTVTLTLQVGPETTEMGVADDGVGLGASDRPGRGLPSMRARAREVGATLSVESRNPGTAVTFSVPLHAGPSAEQAGLSRP